MGKVNGSKVDYWLTEDGLTLLSGWARNSTTKTEIADRLGISPGSLQKWCEKYPEINAAVNTTREVVDFMVENALLKAALGYRTKEIKVTVGKKVVNGEMVEMLKETTTKEVAPNVNAAIMWLNNRKFDDWKRNRDKVVEVDPDDSQVTITIQRGAKQKIDVLGDDEDGDEVNESVTYTQKELEDAESALEDADSENEDSEWDDWDEEEDGEE